MENPKYQEYDHKSCRELVNALLDYQANDTKNKIRREDDERALTHLKIELGEVEKAKEWLNNLPLEKINALGEMEGALKQVYSSICEFETIHEKDVQMIENALQKSDVRYEETDSFYTKEEKIMSRLTDKDVDTIEGSFKSMKHYIQQQLKAGNDEFSWDNEDLHKLERLKSIALREGFDVAR